MNTSDEENGFLWRCLRWLVSLCLCFAGTGIMCMMLVTVADVIVRRFGLSIPGAYDIVSVAGGISIAAALPITTAVKGHVAIEFFFHKLRPGARKVTDSLMRLLQMLLFVVASYAFWVRGVRLFNSGEMMPTLPFPLYILSFFFVFTCVLTAWITFFHLVAPSKKMFKL